MRVKISEISFETRSVRKRYRVFIYQLDQYIREQCIKIHSPKTYVFILGFRELLSVLLRIVRRDKSDKRITEPWDPSKSQIILCYGDRKTESNESLCRDRSEEPYSQQQSLQLCLQEMNACRWGAKMQLRSRSF
jgi:hypothetical protein